MENAPPGHFTCRSFEFTDVVGILGVNATTLNTWLTFAKMLRPFGDKVGHRRVFSQHEAYTLALLTTLSGAGVPIGPSAVRAALNEAFDANGPIIPDPNGTWPFYRSEAAGVLIHTGTVWHDIDQRLKELEC